MRKIEEDPLRKLKEEADEALFAHLRFDTRLKDKIRQSILQEADRELNSAIQTANGDDESTHVSKVMKGLDATKASNEKLSNDKLEFHASEAVFASNAANTSNSAAKNATTKWRSRQRKWISGIVAAAACVLIVCIPMLEKNMNPHRPPLGADPLHKDAVMMESFGEGINHGNPHDGLVDNGTSQQQEAGSGQTFVTQSPSQEGDVHSGMDQPMTTMSELSFPNMEEAKLWFGDRLVVPQYVPEGFQLTSIRGNGRTAEDTSQITLFYSADHGFYQIVQSLQLETWLPNDVDANNRQEADINGTTGYISQYGDSKQIQLTWLSDQHHFMVTGSISEEEALRIARFMLLSSTAPMTGTE